MGAIKTGYQKTLYLYMLSMLSQKVLSVGFVPMLCNISTDTNEYYSQLPDQLPISQSIKLANYNLKSYK